MFVLQENLHYATEAAKIVASQLFYYRGERLEGFWKNLPFEHKVRAYALVQAINKKQLKEIQDVLC